MDGVAEALDDFLERDAQDSLGPLVGKSGSGRLGRGLWRYDSGKPGGRASRRVLLGWGRFWLAGDRGRN